MKTSTPLLRSMHLLSVSFVTFLATGLMVAQPAQQPSQAQADLKAQAKVTEEQASKAALERVPHGKIKSSEIEKERGKLVWSFDITKPDTKNLTQVQVDAKTGTVISKHVETPKEQAKEAAADKAEKK
ncbi:MAG: PepSY domain-containing protein [Acidobacteria bacterium]|nr:PepSY domain-containing protein [Acidobacteriota bacterium]